MPTGNSVNISTAGLVTFDGTGSFGGVSYGTAGWVLTSNGASAPTFQAATGSSPLTTEGDLYTYTTVNARLAIGTRPGFSLITTGSMPQWFNPATDVFLYDDMLSDGNNPYGNTALTANLQNSASTPRITESGRPGIIAARTGTNTNGAARFGHNTQFIAGVGRIVHNFSAKLPALSDANDTYTVRMGLGEVSTATGDIANGAYFQYTHGTNSGNWQIKTAAASSRTTNNTSTAADTNWHLYTIDINAGGTSVSFYIDGSEVANSPIATNIPTAGYFSDSFSIDKDGGAVGTTSRDLYIDLSWIWCKLTSSRF